MTKHIEVLFGLEKTHQLFKIKSNEMAIHIQDIKSGVKIIANRDPTIEVEEVKVNTIFKDKYNTNIAILELKFEMFYN